MNDEASALLHEKFAKADELIKEKLYSDALQALNEIIEEDPTFGKAYNHLGWLYETQFKEYDKAENCYRQAVLYEPNYTAGYINYIYLLSTLNRYDDLKTVLADAEKVTGMNRANINYEYALMYEMTGALDTAVEYYKKAIIASTENSKLQLYKDALERIKLKKEILG